MKHIFETTVYYADTDSYGVVWHGTYLRWMEIGRVEFCRNIGIDLIKQKEENIVIPVTNINIRYKSSAKIEDRLIVETFISKITPVYITFTQNIKNKDTGLTYVVADVDVVAVNNEGKIYRRLPENLKKITEAAMAEQ